MNRDGLILGGTAPTYQYVGGPLSREFDRLQWLLGVALIDQDLPATRYSLGISLEEAQVMMFWRTRRRWLALFLNEALRMGFSLLSRGR